jgi:hypothetical protein
MSVRTTFYHPDRLVIGIFEGEMHLSDFIEFALEIQKNNLIHYRKIVNVIDAHPRFTEQELRALVQMIREAPTDRPRGAVAFVADAERGEFAHLFASLEVDGRPARVFRSIHDARRWLTEMPPVRE